MAKTPNPQVLARVCLCWPPMSVCGKNVYALRACKRSNRDFLRLYTNTYTFSLIQSSSITRRVLRCLLGFLALWGQKPCGGKNVTIFRRFPTILRIFPKIFQNWPERRTNVSEHFPKISGHFPKITEDYRRLPKTTEEDPKMFRSYTNKFKFS